MLGHGARYFIIKVCAFSYLKKTNYLLKRNNKFEERVFFCHFILKILKFLKKNHDPYIDSNLMIILFYFWIH